MQIIARQILTVVALLAFAATTSAMAQSEADKQGVGLPQVTITAQRRAQSEQSAAVPIQAVTGKSLSKWGVVSPEDLMAVATGVNIGTMGDYVLPYVRGVGNFGSNGYAESAVAVNLDGVYISRPWASRGTLFDLARVEILKGPQGTLYGRNATGGAINIISNKPNFSGVNGYSEASIGNYHAVRILDVVNAPLNDHFALRLAGQVVSREGYLADGTDDDHSEALRAQLLYQPNTDLSLLMKFEYEHVGGRGPGTTIEPAVGNPWRGNADPLVNAIYAAEPGIGQFFPPAKPDTFLRNYVYALSAELKWNLSRATLTVIPAFRWGTHVDHIYLPGFTVYEGEYNNQSSLEARLSNESQRLKWVAGLYYFKENGGNAPGWSEPQVGTDGISVFDMVFQRAGTLSLAGFGQTTVSITDRFRLTGGLRYTYESKDTRGNLNAYSPSIFGPCASPTVPVATSPSPFAKCLLQVPYSGATSFTNVSYKAGFEYDLRANSLLWGNVSTGFKSGGFYASPPPNSYSPEKLLAYELGVKNRFFDNRLQANLEAFYWDYTNQQLQFVAPSSQAGFITSTIQNIGKSHSYGGELDVAYLPWTGGRFEGGVQYDKSEYIKFQYPYLPSLFGPVASGCRVSGTPPGVQTVDCAGLPLLRAPLWTGNVGFEQRVQAGSGFLDVSLRANATSSSYVGPDFLPNEVQPAWAEFDADLTYTPSHGNWSVSLWGRNLTDAAVFTQALRGPLISGSNPLAGPNGLVMSSIRPPRTYGLRARYDF